MRHICHILHRTITNDIPSLSVSKEGNIMKLITLYLPEPYIEALNQLVTEKYYPNRAEAIRVAIRDLISDEVWGRKTVG